MLLLIYHWPEDKSLWDVTLCHRASGSQHFEGQLRLLNPEDVDTTRLGKVRSRSPSNNVTSLKTSIFNCTTVRTPNLVSVTS
jgi:hypothetical protein